MSDGLSFRVLGIPVRAGPGILIGLLCLGLLSGFGTVVLVEWLVLGFLAILLHELGHALAFRHYGMKSHIGFWMLGGATIPDDPVSAACLPDRQLLLVSLAGPFVGLLLGGASLAVSLALGTLDRAISTPVALWTFVNLVWAIFNLLPISGLDGGRALVHLAGAAFGRPGRVVGIAAGIGASLAIAFAGLAWGQIYLAFIAVFFGLIGSVQALLDEIWPHRAGERAAVRARELEREALHREQHTGNFDRWDRAQVPPPDSYDRHDRP